MADFVSDAPPVSSEPTGFDYRNVLRQMLEHNASDLHLKVGCAPTLRVNGELRNLPQPPLRSDELKALADQIMPPKRQKEFSEMKEADFALGVPGVGRFRVNAFQQRGTIAYAFRIVPFQANTIAGLNLPPICEQIALKPRGMVLVTGVTGSGKSTALASMIQFINQHRAANIITIEDPIEFLHPHIKATINQREVGSDTQTFALALRAALRQAPKVILVGEMRDVETISIALEASETGHLVLSTLHTIDAAKTIDRIVGVFPKNEERQVRTRFSQAFKWVVSQRLVPKVGGGRVVALEIMIPTPAIRNLIREDKIHQIYSSMQAGQEKLGTQTFNQSLASLYLTRQVTLDSAMAASSLKEELDQMITRGVGVVQGAGLGPRPGMPRPPVGVVKR